MKGKTTSTQNNGKTNNRQFLGAPQSCRGEFLHFVGSISTFFNPVASTSGGMCMLIPLQLSVVGVGMCMLKKIPETIQRKMQL